MQLDRILVFAAACLWLSCSGVSASGQLPPEIQADLYTEQARERLERNDYPAAKALLDRIAGLQQEHGLELPDSFRFEYAQVARWTGLYDEAVEAATQYLTSAGRDGEHYLEALRLLNDIQAAREVIDGMEWARIPAGEFTMGSVRSLTQVRISRAFDLGKYEVTQAEWQAVMGSIASLIVNEGDCEDCPVRDVSWNDVQEFIRRLNAGAGATRYRLPTEAEWAYAARAGTSGDTYAGDLTDRYGVDPVVARIAWFDENSGDAAHPVGQKAPNAWGLHDMLGNVEEWVQDWHGDYPGGSVIDPQGPRWGSRRVSRGGSYLSYAVECRASSRRSHPPEQTPYAVGFRLVRID